MVIIFFSKLLRKKKYLTFYRQNTDSNSSSSVVKNENNISIKQKPLQANISKSFDNIEKLKEFCNKTFFKRSFNGFKYILVTYNNRTYKIDIKEFQNYKTFISHQRYPKISMKWEKRLRSYSLQNILQIETSTLDLISTVKTKLEVIVLVFIIKKANFLKTKTPNNIVVSNNYSKKRMATETIQVFLNKILFLLKYGFNLNTEKGFDDFKDSIEHPITRIIQKLEDGSIVYFDENMKYDQRDFYEVHFQFCFIMFLDKIFENHKECYWEAEKNCTRLHTLISNNNKSSSGKIDVYFVDKDQNKNIVELKYIRPTYKFDKVKTKGIDQVCSYKLDNCEPKLFLLIFQFLNDSSTKLKCDLTDLSGKSYQSSAEYNEPD